MPNIPDNTNHGSMNYNARHSVILLAIPSKENAQITQDMLTSYGFSEFLFAYDGKEAMDITLHSEPDLVLIDINLTDMNAIEYCKNMREIAKFKNLPIIVQTDIQHHEQRTQIFANGATDFISSPLEKMELISRVKVRLENHKLINDLVEYQKHMQQELTTAREMQNLIMPIEPDIIDIEKNHNVSIGSFFKPSYEMGGDFWGINSADNDIVDLYAVDFSGHGVTAAINTFRLHTIMYSSIGRLSAGEYLEYLNKKITPLISSDQFATMFFGTIDSRTNKLTYATAGTTDAILVTNNMTEIITLDGSGFPIGITTSSKYDTKEIEFNKNDMLILYSDALIETPNNKKEFFLTEHIVDFLAENIKNSKSYNARHAVSDILTEFNNKYSHNLNDDLTLVAVSR